MSVFKLHLRPESHGSQLENSRAMEGLRPEESEELDTTPAEASFRSGTEHLTNTLLKEVLLLAFKI